MTIDHLAPAAAALTRRLDYRPLLPLGVLRAVVFFIVALKLVFAVIVPPGYDDAYYWLWGQHPQWSYLDHAPMVGWGAWVSWRLLGWTPFAQHFMPLVTFALSVVAMRQWAKRLVPDHWRHFFWASLAIFLASPLLMAISTVLYPDQAMMAAGLGSVLFLGLFLADWRVGQVRWGNLFAGAVLLGLAMLSKYNGALIGLGLLGAVVVDAKLRPLFREPKFYLAAIVALLFLAPIVYWNATNDFASLRFHSSDRFTHGNSGLALYGPVRFLLETAVFLSPFLIWPLLKSLFTRRVAGPEGAMIAMGRWMFVPLTLAFAGLSAWAAAATQVSPHWEIMGLVPFVLLAPLFIRSRWLFALHLAFGTIVATLAVAYFALSPLLTDALGISDGEATRQYGLEQVGTAVEIDKWLYGADFAAAPHFHIAAKLAWGLGSDKNVISLADVIDQFYFWNDLSRLAGHNGIIVTEGPIGANSYPGQFASVMPIGEITPSRFGHALPPYFLYLGRGYHGTAPLP